MANINPYLAQTSRMSPYEWNLYSDFLDTQADMMGLPDRDALTRDQLDTSMAMWQVPKAFGRGFGLTLGMILGGVTVGLALALILAAKRRSTAQAAQQAQPPAWW